MADGDVSVEAHRRGSNCSGKNCSPISPMIEKVYRVAAGSENRGITGLSMGGGQAFTIGMKHMGWTCSHGSANSARVW